METTVRIANQADISAIFDIRTSVTENHLSHDQLNEMGITPDAIRYVGFAMRLGGRG